MVDSENFFVCCDVINKIEHFLRPVWISLNDPTLFRDKNHASHIIKTSLFPQLRLCMFSVPHYNHAVFRITTASMKNYTSIAHQTENPLRRTSEHIHIFSHLFEKKNASFFLQNVGFIQYCCTF